MHVVARRAVAVLGFVLAGSSLTACTPPAERFTVRNDLDRAVSLWWGQENLGSVDAHARAEIYLFYGHSCVDGPVRAVTDDGEAVVMIPAGRACPDSDVRLVEDDLEPATATATVVNTRRIPADLTFVTGQPLTAEPGEEVEVPLQVPAGQCLAIPRGPLEPAGDDRAPEFWGSALCDGDVVPLALVGAPSVVVDNRTDADLAVVDGATALGTVAAGARAALPLPGAGCLEARVRALDPDHGRVAALPEVCPADVLVVDHLVPAAVATLTSHAEVPVTMVVAGETLGSVELTLEPGAVHRLALDSPADTCALVTATPDPHEARVLGWSGYLCDGMALDAHSDRGSSGWSTVSWEASW